MYKNIFDAISKEFSGEIAKQNVISIHYSDVWSDYKSFRKTAQWCVDKMKKIGLDEVELIPHKADGRSKLGIVTPPEAWDAYDAKLEIVLPNGTKRVIADYRSNPVSLAMYSAPTNGVVEAEVIDLDMVKKQSDLKGKIVLSYKSGIVDYVMKNGAIGLILDSVSQPWVSGKRMKETDAVYWHNNCFVPKNKYGGFAFVVSPAEGEKLREILRRNIKVIARAYVNTKLYSGEVYTVTGIIPGVDSKYKREEILVFSHLYEVGANDNASGCGVNLEVARTLVSLIKNKILPEPRRTIRFILGCEICGLLSFFRTKENKDLKVIAGINLDMVGEDEDKTSATLVVGKSLPSNPSFVNDFLVRLIEETYNWQPFRWKEGGYAISDDDSFISHPSIGVPTPSLMYINDRFYHSDKDTPDKVSVISLKRAGAVAGTYLYFFANAGLNQAYWLGEDILRRAKNRLIKEVQNSLTKFTGNVNIDFESLNKKLNYLINIETSALSNLSKLVVSKWDKGLLRDYIHKLSEDLRESIRKFYKDKVITLYHTGCVSIKEVINLYKEDEVDKGNILEKNKLAHSLIPEQTFSGIPISWLFCEKDTENFGKISKEIPNVRINEILSWVDGKRTILEIFNIISLVNKINLKDLIKFFKLMSRYGYIRFKKNERIKKQELIKDLKSMGIRKGDVLFVHSSLSSIGLVEGGADTVVEALIESVGKEGLIIVPTLSWSFLGNYFAFNPKKTPSRVGEITNALLKRKDAFRSEHPTHSIGAVGKGAEELVKGHTGSTFAKDSPYGKYVRLNAKIIFIGTGIGCNTTLHAVEDWLDLPYLTTERAIVERTDGREEIVKVTKSPSGCRDFYKKDSKIEKVFKESGIIKEGKLGNADVIMMKARDVVNTTIREIEKGKLDILLCDNPKCKFCTNGKKLLQKNKDKIMKNIEELKKIGLYSG